MQDYGVTVIWASPRFEHPHSQNPRPARWVCPKTALTASMWLQVLQTEAKVRLPNSNLPLSSVDICQNHTIRYFGRVYCAERNPRTIKVRSKHERNRAIPNRIISLLMGQSIPSLPIPRSICLICHPVGPVDGNLSENLCPGVRHMSIHSSRINLRSG